jgi:hypothetical protein
VVDETVQAQDEERQVEKRRVQLRAKIERASNGRNGRDASSRDFTLAVAESETAMNCRVVDASNGWKGDTACAVRKSESVRSIYQRCAPSRRAWSPGNLAISWDVTRLPTSFQRRTAMPALLIPVLWVGGAVVLLGGGYYIVQAMH